MIHAHQCARTDVLYLSLCSAMKHHLPISPSIVQHCSSPAAAMGPCCQQFGVSREVEGAIYNDNHPSCSVSTHCMHHALLRGQCTSLLVEPATTSPRSQSCIYPKSQICYNKSSCGSDCSALHSVFQSQGNDRKSAFMPGSRSHPAPQTSC